MRLDLSPVARLITKLALLWIAFLVLPFTERTLIGAKTYYLLYIGLGLVFVMYGLTMRSVFFSCGRSDERWFTFGLRF